MAEESAHQNDLSNDGFVTAHRQKSLKKEHPAQMKSTVLQTESTTAEQSCTCTRRVAHAHAQSCTCTKTICACVGGKIAVVDFFFFCKYYFLCKVFLNVPLKLDVKYKFKTQIQDKDAKYKFEIVDTKYKCEPVSFVT